jgi:DNA repair protein RadA/Sms
MSKTKSVFACQSCGYHTPKWLGRCPDCGAWNTFVEEQHAMSRRSTQASTTPTQPPLPLTQVARSGEERLLTGIGELDRVLGGGVVSGSLVLVGGDPGIGKSTLLLQAAAGLSRRLTHDTAGICVM